MSGPPLGLSDPFSVAQVAEVDNKAAAFNKAIGDPELVANFERAVEDWYRETEALLAEQDTLRQEAEDPGPETELDYWRNRTAKLSSIGEQLKGRDYRVTMGVLSAAKSKGFKRWKGLDAGIADANNEAKDNYKYVYIYLPIYLSIFLSIFLSVYLSIYLYVQIYTLDR